MIALTAIGFGMVILGWVFRVSLNRTDVRPLLSNENYDALVRLFNGLMSIGVGLTVLGMML